MDRVAVSTLSEGQIAFFARNGYLQLPRALPEADCDHLVEETWKRLPATWARNDPRSWGGDVRDSCHVASLDYRRGHLKFQKGELVHDAVIERCFGFGSAIEAHALSLIARRLTKIRVRGLYPNVPPPEKLRIREFTAPHVEAHPALLVALCYLSDVKPSGGGLLVWPGSHRALYPAFSSKLEFSKADEYDRQFDRWSRLRPVELCGSRGDVLLTHHRLFHAPSLNRSEAIRFAFLCDYVSADYPALCRQAPGELWEDWLPVRQVEAGLGSTAPDQSLDDWTDKDRSAAAIFRPEHASTINKRDASAVARSRKPGEVWLSLTDSPDEIVHFSLDPCGSNIAAQGAKVVVNGTEVSSLSTNGIINRLPLTAGENTIVVSGLRNASWLRLIRTAVPFSDSILLHRAGLAAGSDRYEIALCLDGTTGAPTITGARPSRPA